MAKKRTHGSWRYGELPDTAPLAMAYVPLQKSVSPAYESMEALSRGTLFPGLDLPFMGMVNQTQEVTPLTEMMALCFVAHELALYLDNPCVSLSLNASDAILSCVYNNLGLTFISSRMLEQPSRMRICLAWSAMLGSTTRGRGIMTGRGRADACLYMRRNCSIRCVSRIQIPPLQNS